MAHSCGTPSPQRPLPGVISPGHGLPILDLTHPHIVRLFERAYFVSDAVYRERAHLVAHLASLYPSVLSYSDPTEPDWPVLTVETPAGQMSWHVVPGDLDLLGHVPLVDSSEVTWDGHTTQEKYGRLDRLTRKET